MTSALSDQAMRTGTGLSRITISLPDHVDSVADVLREAGSRESEVRLFTGMFGLRDSPSWPLEQSAEDLLIDVTRRALADRQADLILYGHTILAQEMNLRPGFAARMLAALGLETATFVGVSGVACAAPLRAIELARDYLSTFPDRTVLVIAGDKGVRSPVTRVIPRMTVAGGGLGAFLMAREGIRYRLLASARRSDTRFHRGRRMEPNEFAQLNKVSADLLVEALDEATGTAGIATPQLDWVMPHQLNALAWRFFSERVGIPHERFLLDLLPTQGHLYGLDALSSLADADRRGVLQPGDRCALMSVGQGAYISVLVVEVVADE
jgi:3-oxoacyl-[acyl-carrier-protein] synthase-3